MTKEQIEKEATVFATYYKSLFPNDFETFYKAFLKVAEPREKRIAELAKACDETEELLDKQIKATYKTVEELNVAKALLKRWIKLYKTNTVKGIIADTEHFLKE